MPRGSRPGERRGGRKAGTPNQKTIEKRERERQVEEAAAALLASGEAPTEDQSVLRRALARTQEVQKTPREIAYEMLLIQRNICITYHNHCRANPPGTPEHDAQAWTEMRYWMNDAQRTAVSLADFYEPKYKSIMVASSGPGVGNAGDDIIDLNALEPGTEATDERVQNSYLRLVKGKAAA